IMICIALFALIANLSIKSSLTNFVASKINNNPACPITYQKLDISFFLPKVILSDVLVDGLCFNAPGQSLALKELVVRISLPGILPPGLGLKIMGNSGDTNATTYLYLSWATQSFKIEKTVIGHLFINQLLRHEALEGQLNLEAVGEIRKAIVHEASFKVISKDLQIPAQLFNGLQIPQLAINSISIKGQLAPGGDLRIQEFIIGDEKSPIRGRISGKIKVNFNDPAFSETDLTAEVRFSQDFLENFSILKILLNSYKQKDGFYQIRINGPIGSPMPRPL
ncbi:MAG: hypothetical protein WCG27_11930, partial [Pseudomonadota bacterium]